MLSEGKGINCNGRKYKCYSENLTPPIKFVFVFVIYFQMEQLDEASKPDIPYPYEMSARGNGTRVNRYLPKPSVSNI